MRLAEIIDSFQGLPALVVGDLMLDEYIFGRATRISQEAPVMVVRQVGASSVPGGAANVAMNMAALGAVASTVGVVGDDAAGVLLGESLRARGIQSAGLIRDASRPTTRKVRVVANHSHQVLRIDHEDETPVSREIEQKLLDMALDALPNQRVVLVSDYQKGSISDWGIRTIVEAAGKAGIPVVANPKPKSLLSYSGACLVSLNRFEAADALHLDEISSSEAATVAARQLRESLGVENILVTLGGDGMVAASASGSFHVPAIPVAVYDEAGAGDTVIATLALAVAAGNFGREALELASRAAAAVVRKVGVATPSKQDLDELRDL